MEIKLVERLAPNQGAPNKKIKSKKHTVVYQLPDSSANFQFPRNVFSTVHCNQ